MRARKISRPIAVMAFIGLVGFMTMHVADARVNPAFFVRTTGMQYGVNYVDFSLTGGYQGPLPQLPGGQNYQEVFLGGYGGCYEIYTQQAFVQNGDTRIWVKLSNASSYSNLDDDSGDGLYSFARLWVNGTGLSIALAGYSTSYNSMDFSFTLNSLSQFTTAAACDDGSSSYAKLENNTLTIVRSH